MVGRLPRRRRLRLALSAGAAAAGAPRSRMGSVAWKCPVEVSPGERVRIVIELIVRPAAGQPTETARPAATVAVQTATVVDDARGTSLPARPQPLAAPTTPRRSLHAPTGSASAHPERRR